jgi:hypothetical protein
MPEPADVLEKVASALSDGRLETAAAALKKDYPFIPITRTQRRYTPAQCLQVFLRDGFVDRYSGRRLVYPGALRLLSMLLPVEFPFHRNWRTDCCHFAYYELFPTIDHLVPVSRGGKDSFENWITTSMLRNATKANFTLDEVGWTLREPGTHDGWDGLMNWFLAETDKNPDLLKDRYIMAWSRVARRQR